MRFLHFPEQVDVVGHNDEPVYFHPFVLHQKPQAVQDDVFILVRPEQVLPLQNGGGEKGYMLLLKHKLSALIVGENTNNGVKKHTFYLP
jgi:hypothetical protein